MSGQVRRTVGALVGVAQGRASLQDIQRMLDEPSHQNWMNVTKVVSPAGLYLLEVVYPPSAFCEKEGEAEVVITGEVECESEGEVKGEVEGKSERESKEKVDEKKESEECER